MSAYLEEHTRLVSERSKPGLTSGIAASLSRRIGTLELELELEGTPYEPFVPPSQSAASLADKSNAELIKLHTEAVENRMNASTAGRKAGYTSAIRRLEETMRKREGLQFTPWSPRAVNLGLTDEELLTRVHAVRQLLSRGDQVRPRIRKVAESELRHLTDLASERNLSVSAAPIETAPETPVVNAGDALDKVSAEVAADVEAAHALSAPTKRTRKTAA